MSSPLRPAICLLLAALLLLAGARAAEPETLRGLDDLTRARIALVAGSSHDEHVARRYPQAQVLQFKATPDVVLAVSTGKADVAFLALESVREIFRTTPNLAILVPEAYRSPMGAAFRPDDTTLRPAYNAFVRGLRESGMYEAMRDAGSRKARGTCPRCRRGDRGRCCGWVLPPPRACLGRGCATAPSRASRWSSRNGSRPASAGRWNWSTWTFQDKSPR
ncbi:MAG: hypothetical protein B9S27_03460 [Opitutia bacterium Tous-C8FEB]|nr:MAG: hypothetical protein B9S27_03460 [Opitutae bacterium Tous-C8FEB]